MNESNFIREEHLKFLVRMAEIQRKNRLISEQLEKDIESIKKVLAKNA